MQQIEIDFEVWKALTSQRESETCSYNDVLRKLLGLPHSIKEKGTHKSPAGGGRVISGRFLPDGTRLRAQYKGALYEAEIKDGKLLGSDGRSHASASAAATAITNTTVNGLSFWEARRPGDGGWRKISLMAKSQ